ncbi:MarR family winged helix-turn-helix transcriptional regulator [Erythrobacter sp. JK5]|uniref:MarR family winged helix-turn-helix transcriptional regulator n=1 Tax=Erythrobacter sp. JK5 TaxID=2829500 RepID=UPI001BACF250|nr:winged helix DNA-binding protein [Erythrobacter sp. JK5]QUL37554.1 MarR family transcriptional regulator [Erythrobacter sp. JK5]
MHRLTYEDLLFLRQGIDSLLAEHGGDDDAQSEGGEDGEPIDRSPTFPSVRTIKSTIRRRKLRSKFFDEKLFFDPCWEMLLDLALVEAEGRRVAITSLCIASGVPQVTALRHLNILAEAGLVERQPDPIDKRRVFVALTPNASKALAQYFQMANQPLPLAA